MASAAGKCQAFTVAGTGFGLFVVQALDIGLSGVINGDYGIAIAYSRALIVLMLIVILLIQLLVGERRLGR